MSFGSGLIRTLFILGVTAALASSVGATPPPGTNWRKVFQDNFDGNKLDTNKWSYGYPWGNLSGDNAFMSPGNVKVRDGHLLITGTNTRHPAAPETFTTEDGDTPSLKIAGKSGKLYAAGLTLDRAGLTVERRQNTDSRHNSRRR